MSRRPLASFLEASELPPPRRPLGRPMQNERIFLCAQKDTLPAAPPEFLSASIRWAQYREAVVDACRRRSRTVRELALAVGLKLSQAENLVNRMRADGQLEVADQTLVGTRWTQRYRATEVRL